MSKVEPINRGYHRFYPCPKCAGDHPSCTTLLAMIASPALMGWAAKNGTAKLKVFSDAVLRMDEAIYKAAGKQAEELWRLTEDTAFWKSGREIGKDAADYGTLAHAWFEAHLNGREVTIESLPEPSQKAVRGFLEWEKETHLEVIATEETFCNCQLNYAGTADVVAKVNGELALGDWKTSKGIYFAQAIQAWAYALADESQHGDRLYREVFIGRFGKDGSWEVRRLQRNSFPGIEVARAVMVGCEAIFQATTKWDQMFPYEKPSKKEKA